MSTFPYPADPIAASLTESGVRERTSAALAQAESIKQSIRALAAKDGHLTWEETFGALDDLVLAIQEAACAPGLLAVTHSDAAVRKAAQESEPKVSAFASDLYLDAELAAVLRRFAAQQEPLPHSRQKFMDDTLREFRRNGLELPAGRQERLRAINEQLTKLSQDFETVLAETTLSLEVTPEQLDGLPESFIANHPVNANGRITLTTQYPDLMPFMKYATDRNAAKALHTLAEQRGAEQNIPTLKNILTLRQEKAELLGYATWADYITEMRMAKSPAAVKTFLWQLHEGLKAKRIAEAKELETFATTIWPNHSGKIPSYNAGYVQDHLRKERFTLDSQEVSKYFEVRSVINGVMHTAEQLYGITFMPVNAPTWHTDVTAYNVMENGTQIARIYLDMYPREGKYGHAAMFDIRGTKMLDNGTRLMPMAALVCNFPKPGASPALMSHDDVVTTFHEFGHLIHHILSTTELATVAGTNVARDFVETPSQLFENWAWDYDVLKTFAKHVITGEPLPRALFDAMTTARDFGIGIATERQLFFATYDMELHTRNAQTIDPETLGRELYNEFSSFERLAESRFPSTFGHLMGYSAAYYSYQWALALAYDVFTRFKAEGIMNLKTAADYRHTILEQGSSLDEAELVTAFLGRPASPNAYLEYLGIKTS